MCRQRRCLQTLRSGGNAKGGGDGVGHECTDGFYNGLAGAGRGVIYKDSDSIISSRVSCFVIAGGPWCGWMEGRGTGGGREKQSHQRLFGRKNVGPADEFNIGVCRVVFSEFDSPAAGLMAVSTAAFPFAGDPRTGRGDQMRESGMIGKEFPRLVEGFLDVEDVKGVPAGVETAVEHNVLGIVGGEAAGGILDGALESFEGLG